MALSRNGCNTKGRVTSEWLLGGVSKAMSEQAGQVIKRKRRPFMRQKKVIEEK